MHDRPSDSPHASEHAEAIAAEPALLLDALSDDSLELICLAAANDFCGGATVIANNAFVDPSLTSYTFPLNPGKRADYKVWTRELDGTTRVEPAMSGYMVMAATAPDTIGADGAT